MTADVHAPPPVAGHASSTFLTAHASSSASSTRLSVHFADPPVAGTSAPGPAEEEDDYVASVVSNPPVVDKSVARFVTFIHEQYPESHPLSAPSLAPRCGFEALCALSKPPESTQPRFRLYSQLEEILTDVCGCTDILPKTYKPLSSILLRCHRSHLVADVANFNAPLSLNSKFSLLVENKTVSSKRVGIITFFEMERMKSSTRLLLPPTPIYGFFRASSPLSRKMASLRPTRRSLIPPSLPWSPLCRDRRVRPLR